MNNEKINDEKIKLLRSEEKFKRLFELSPVGMALIYYESHKFIEVNNELLRTVGYSEDELMKMTFWDITPEKYRDQEIQQFKDIEQYGKFGPNEKEYIRKDGSIVPVRISGFVLEDVDGSKIVWGITEDISVEKENQNIMNKLAFTDPLTNLANRRLMSVKFEQFQVLCNVNGKSFGLLYLDINNFKQINDKYGHDAGDLVLKHVSNCIKEVVKRDTDVISRIGGDEFIIMMLDITTVDVLNSIRNRINETLKTPFEFDNNIIDVAASIGVALYPENGTTEREILKTADIDMYKMKNQKDNI